MIRIRTNIGSVIDINIVKLQSLAKTDKMLRTAATSVLGVMKNRIHEKGLDADGVKIGTYSKGYMKIRTGNFENSARVSRGKNKGKLKDAGVFTKKKVSLYGYHGVSVFADVSSLKQARPRYNRTNDTTVVASLTRQMENDMKVIGIKDGYGIGYTNKFNFDKSQWVEATYKRKGKIFALSTEEKDIVIKIAHQHTKDAVS